MTDQQYKKTNLAEQLEQRNKKAGSIRPIKEDQGVTKQKRHSGQSLKITKTDIAEMALLVKKRFKVKKRNIKEQDIS